MDALAEQRPVDAAGWNRIIADLPGAHILQTWEWGNVKSNYGWQPIYCVWTQRGDEVTLQHRLPDPGERVVGAALVLMKGVQVGALQLPFRIMYVPKGPLTSDWGRGALRRRVLDDLAAVAQRSAAISVKVDPDVPLGTGVLESDAGRPDPIGLSVKDELSQRGWMFSSEQVQFRNTVIVDLSPSEGDLLAKMKQKTRYNVRLATRRGVAVRQGSIDDLEMLYQMYVETSVRDGFVIREAGYYADVWRSFVQAGLAVPLIAEVDRSPVAGLIIFLFARRCWYLYGMSRQAHRDKMPNHLLQWEAMLHAKSAGCLSYDLWGAPDVFSEADPLWGVFRFKDGFGGDVVRHIGAWDLPVRPLLYRAYTQILPRLLNVMRQRSITRLRQSYGA